MTIAFVAGATGYTGREVVRALRARGCETVAHVRSDSPRLEQWRARFGPMGARVDASPWELTSMTATLTGLRPDVVFALLGTTRARARRERAGAGRDAGYEAVDYGLTMMLLAAARACGSQPRFVYLSAIGVHEGTTNPYLAVRARVEAALREGSLPYTIARPSFITGPDRDEFRPAERIGAWLVDGVLSGLAHLGSARLRERYGSMTNLMLAEALVRVALDPGMAGRVVEAEELRRQGAVALAERRNSLPA